MCKVYSKPDKCPVCGNEYLARVPKRLDTKLKVSELYRHRSKGALYLHRITRSPLD